MSDLSRLLDDVYEPAVKDNEKGWTSDEALDDAFSGWVPGPAEDASETERSLFAEAKAATTDEHPAPLSDLIPSASPADRIESAPDHDLAGRVSPADAWATVHDGDTPFEEPVAVATTWSPEDDDILPKRGASRRLLRFNLSLRR
jgi:hypothetical protein